MRRNDIHTSRILQLIEDEGPMSRAEICARLNLDKERSSAVVSRLNKPGARTPKRVYVCAYVYDMEGERYYPRAVFALGDLPDKPKPKVDLLAVRKRSREKLKKLRTANFVFHLALPRRVYERM
ncbi:hypothetical protein UFOVP601_33 [uncultured Caudovirales phage]|uniref:Winged helix-turn-helix DNA-binding n=1 Tax=uncultured Caudovirales phage TaxID=2100421 RepID=A0A6J5N0D6_9CAUD|nr:hypothetical protein UFOVP601_33 [uncultured Caudovirales phage]